MRGGWFLISVVTACLLAGCSSGSWTTVEADFWEIRPSEAGLIFFDIGPAEECKIVAWDSPDWDMRSSESAWGMGLEFIDPEIDAHWDEYFQVVYLRDCVGVRHTRDLDLFHDFNSERYEQLGRHRCEADVLIYKIERWLTDRTPYAIERHELKLETGAEILGDPNTSLDDAEGEALTAYKAASDAISDAQRKAVEEGERLVELKEVDCEREKRKAE